MRAQDTFSLLAYDSQTGEIVSAGASCIDANVVAGGARVISSIIPGVGAIHTQSLYMAEHQRLGDKLLSRRLSAKPLLDSLLKADVALQPSFRQYIVLTQVHEKQQLAGETGTNCFPWAGHWLGADVAIAGNILLDSLVLVRMREAYLATEGEWIGDKAMAALQAVAYPGADRRCLSAGLSSRSAFIRVARPTDPIDALTLDVLVDFPEPEADPIVTLAARYREAKAKLQF